MTQQRHRVHGTPQPSFGCASVTNGITDVQPERLRNGFVADQRERQPDVENER